MTRALILFFVICGLFSAHAQGVEDSDKVRIKDLGKVAGWRDNAMVGYGLVTGLAGSGDSSRNKATRQSMANLLTQFDISLSSDQVMSRNVAMVMVTASLPAFARVGDPLDVTVTSMGDARSLLGGTLILAPLKGPDGKVYALAQGAVSIGGYKYDVNGNIVQKNHPTVGIIPSGATIEVSVPTQVVNADQSLMFVLAQPDYTTASRVSNAINEAMGTGTAHANDASGIQIQLRGDRQNDFVGFMKTLENLRITPDRRAKVVINERTGTVVTGGDVRISKVAISQGELKISVITDNLVSQPILVSRTGPDVRTETVSNSRVYAQEKDETGYVAPNHNTVADLVYALTKIKTSTRDIISILQAVKAAGAMHADLVIQ
jgi:flagellar P-ring protein FlgI